MIDKSNGGQRAERAYGALVEMMTARKGVMPAHMFGSEGLKVGGRVFVMRYRGSLVAKLPRARVDELVAAKIGTNFNPGHGRIMKEWIEVAGHHARWREIANEAFAFVRRG